GLLPCWPAVDRHLPGESCQPLHLLFVITATGNSPLEHQGSHRNLPALVLRADQVCLRHPHVLKEHLVEVSMPVGEYEWSHSNARGLHVYQQVADALVLGSVRVGAHEHEYP